MDGISPGAGTPRLALDGFDGSLEDLLRLARAQQVDLARISVGALIEQLAIALQRPATLPIGQRGDWVVMAAWLLLLRSRWLPPDDAPDLDADQQAAETEAGGLHRRLLALHDMQALAAWLERRPQLGQDVFLNGQPDHPAAAAGDTEADVIAFLWASLALFDADLPAPDLVPRYQPVWLDLHSVADARVRIIEVLGGGAQAQPFERLLPQMAGEAAPAVLRAKSAWSSTFAAGLELAKQGRVAMTQPDAFLPITVGLAASDPTRLARNSASDSP